jgi:hypothetical protein
MRCARVAHERPFDGSKPPRTPDQSRSGLRTSRINRAQPRIASAIPSHRTIETIVLEGSGAIRSTCVSRRPPPSITRVTPARCVKDPGAARSARIPRKSSHRSNATLRMRLTTSESSKADKLRPHKHLATRELLPAPFRTLVAMQTCPFAVSQGSRFQNRRAP